MSTNFRGAPGVYTAQSLTPRNIFTQQSATQVQVAPSTLQLDGTLSRDTGSSTPNLLRAGLLLGLITSGSKYRPSVIGVTAAAATNGATSITVNAAVATEVARLIAQAGASINLKLVGPPSAAGVVAVLSATCSAASGTTLTVGAIGAALAAGSLVCPADGSHIPRTVLTKLYGLDMTDINGASIDQPLGTYLRGADLLSAQVINYLADDYGNTVDSSVTTWIKQQLQAMGPFSFDSDRR